MDQHPVPRNITGFQFQLIGSMTLKQFLYLAFGAVIAFIFFKSPIGIFRIPLAALSAFLGVAFAFFPIQERPLEIWVVNFVRSIYAPTQYLWRKENRLLPIFTQQFGSGMLLNKNAEEQLANHHETREKLQEYLQTVAPRKHTQLDEEETTVVTGLTNLFRTPLSSQQPVVTTPIQPAQPQPLQKTVRHTTPPLPKGMIAGLVRTDTTPLPNLLIHVSDANNHPVRLFKTSDKGTFTSALPLPEGRFHLTVEDPTGRYRFTPINFVIDHQNPLHPWLLTPSGEIH